MTSRSWRQRLRALAAMVSDSRSVTGYIWGHPANDGQKVRALLRSVRFQIRGRMEGRPTLARLGAKSYVWAYPHRTGASKVIYANPPDYAEMLAWRRALRPGDLFLDVGANVGSYSIWAAELGAKVIALEPSEDTFRLLLENIALNGYEIDAIQAAAGAECGLANFTEGQDCVNRFDAEGTVQTEVVTIDSLIGNRLVAGMKIDVEGSEIDVLLGSSRALAQQRIRLIQLEWNSASQEAVGMDRLPVANLLTRYGYHLYRPNSQGTLVPVRDASFGPDVFAHAGG
jgi:FkbM family methyltransferase